MIEIIPFKKYLPKVIDIPGSKYIANRALIIAALARGSSKISNVPINNDINTAIAGLRQFGVDLHQNNSTVLINGLNGTLSKPKSPIYTSASGTFSRFILSVGGLLESQVELYGTEKMNHRPMKDLILALEDLGVTISHTNYHMPLSTTGPLKGGKVSLNGAISSQYFSSLLISGIFAKNCIDLEVHGHLVSSPYIKMTIDLMKYFNAHVDNYNYKRFVIQSGQSYFGQTLTIESDPVSSSYFLGAGALLGQEVTISNFNQSGVQGESRFIDVLQKMGCRVHISNNSITLKGPKKLKGIEVDMGNMPDVVQTLAILAAFAQGTTHIKNIGHLKHKESDRIGDTARELKKMGIEVKHTEDSLTIEGGNPCGAIIQTHEDHRMAMSFALAGLKIPNLRINNPEVVEKSFPTFWNVLTACGVKINNL